MHHLVLLGDSILDNAAYTAGRPAVVDHVRRQLPVGWRASLNAVDGATTEDVYPQLAALPADATHLLLSVSGNNALLCIGILDTPVSSTAETLNMMSALVRDFELAYRRVVKACIATTLPLVICTIYHGSFPDPDFQQRAVVTLTIFNDIIIRVAVESRLRVIDLRFVATMPADFVNAIEPSASGGEKIARAIEQAVTEPAHGARGANIVAG